MKWRPRRSTFDGTAGEGVIGGAQRPPDLAEIPGRNENATPTIARCARGDLDHFENHGLS